MQRYDNLFPSSTTPVNLPMGEVRRLAKYQLHRQWIHNFETMMDFKEKYGRFPGRSDVYMGFEIGIWVANQRQKYKRDQMPFWRYEVLAKVNFPWGVASDWWDRFRQCKKWLEEHGLPPAKKANTTPLERRLYYWRTHQKVVHSQGRLTPDQVKAMEDACLFDSIIEFQNRKKLAEFKEFLEKNNRTPSGISSDRKERVLWNWSCGVYYRNMILDKSGKKYVLEAYSKYSKQHQDETIWERNFKNYLAFMQKNGRAPGKIRSDKHQFFLSNWRNHQLHYYRRNKLPQNHRRLLKKYGILDTGQPAPKRPASHQHDNSASAGNSHSNPSRRVRFSRKNSVDWRDKFHQCKKWVEDHGSLPGVGEKSTAQERQLYWWLRRQNIAHSNGELTPDQVKAMKNARLFDSIDEFKSRKRLAEFKEFVEKNNRMPSGASFNKKERDLYGWYCVIMGKNIKFLDEAGRKFILNIRSKYSWQRKLEMIWERNFNAYVAFLQKKGRAPKHITSDKPQYFLYSWRKRQIQYYRCGKLPPNRIRLLKKYGILDAGQPASVRK